MRKRLVWAVIATCLLTIMTFSADAQSDLDAAEAAVIDASERLERLLGDLEAAQRRGDELSGQYWQVESGLRKLDGEIAVAEATVERLDSERQALQVEVRVLALDQYVTGSSELGLTDHEAEADRAAAETLARLVVGSDLNAMDELAAVGSEFEQARDSLQSQRADQALALSDVQLTQEALFVELEQLTNVRMALDGELLVLEAALVELEAAEARRQAEVAELERIAEARLRAEAAAAAAAEQARALPTPLPQPTVAPTATVQPTAVPTPTAEPTVVPNPEPTVPNPQLPSTVVPNPEPTVPNPQPSQPLPVQPAPQSGGIVCPLSGPFTHTDDFNAPRQVGGIHRANDLISPQGTPVLAVASGVVEHRESRVGGLSAHLRGDNGDYYFYTHLSGYENVGAGHVPAGTVIGYVGMTGNAPIPHLHFEIHQGGYGNYTNPYGPVRNACF